MEVRKIFENPTETTVDTFQEAHTDNDENGHCAQRQILCSTHQVSADSGSLFVAWSTVLLQLQWQFRSFDGYLRLHFWMAQFKFTKAEIKSVDLVV